MFHGVRLVELRGWGGCYWCGHCCCGCRCLDGAATIVVGAVVRAPLCLLQIRNEVYNGFYLFGGGGGVCALLALIIESNRRMERDEPVVGMPLIGKRSGRINE